MTGPPLHFHRWSFTYAEPFGWGARCSGCSAFTRLGARTVVSTIPKVQA